MAATLTAGQELIRFSFPIEKSEDTTAVNPLDGTPDIVIWGKATDGTVDGDREIVDPEWSAKALREWLDTGGNVRMAHDPRQPVGKGMHVEITPDGHYVKSLIADPKAKHFIRMGIISDYSVGISNPDFRYRDPTLDPAGKAARIITGRPDGSTRISELSIVDRGSNFNTKFQIAKAAADGTCEFTGKVLGGDLDPKGDTVTVDLPADVSVSVSPADLAKLATFRRKLAMQQAGAAKAATNAIAGDPAFHHKVIVLPPGSKVEPQKPVDLNTGTKTADPDVAKRDFDPNVGGGVDRDKLPDSDFAGKHRSFPIVTPEDVSDALHSIGRAGPDNYSPEKLKKRILAIARRKGFPIPESDKPGEKDTKGKADVPDEVKCVKCGGAGEVDGQPCPQCRPAHTETTPPAGADKTTAVRKKKCKACGGTGHTSDGDSCAACAGTGTRDVTKNTGTHHAKPARENSETSKKGKKGKKGKGGLPEAFIEHENHPGDTVKAGKPTPGEHAVGAAEHDMRPVPPHREPDGAEVEAFEDDAHMQDGDAHDPVEQPTPLEKPTLDGDCEKAALLRFKAAGVTDPVLGVLHDLTCPAYHPGDVARHHPTADLASLISEEFWARKALDAVSVMPLPQAARIHGIATAARALKNTDPVLLNDWRLEAHKAFRDANPGPGSFPTPGEVSPRRFSRPILTAGHAADSPGNTPGVHTTGVHPAAGDVTAAQFTRGPVTAGHAADSPASKTTPAGGYPQTPGVPQPVNYTHVEHANARHALQVMHDHVAETFPDVCPMALSPTPRPAPHPVPAAQGAGDAARRARKTAKAAAKAAKLEKKLRKARKTAGITPQKKEKGKKTDAADAAVAKTAGYAPPAPDVTKAVGDAVAPLLDSYQELLGKVARQEKLLKKQTRLLDALADQPDPSTAAFKGVAINPPQVSARPAGPRTVAEAADRAQATRMQQLREQWLRDPNPAQREAAERELFKMAGLIP